MDFKPKLDKYFTKIQRNNAECTTQAMVWSGKNKIDYKFPSVGHDQPFHIASVGKMMTASLIGILSDKGMLDINENICNYLTDDTTQNLFVYKGVDYKSQITIRQLLNHTSGVADYFDCKTNAGSKFVDIIIATPDKIWRPIELVDFTRNNQSAKSAPGKFAYSDTGYVLLGLIIENITKMPFQEALSVFIFNPLSMKDSYLLFGGLPINPKRKISNIWFNKKEISKLNMLSCDWAGGGIISTLSDLLIFQKALWHGKLVSSDYLQQMITINSKFHRGIYYGGGMMELRLEGFFFLLRGLPRPKGHSGILGTLMFYDEKNDLHTIVNLGSNKRVINSFKVIIYIEQLISRAVKATRNRS